MLLGLVVRLNDHEWGVPSACMVQTHIVPPPEPAATEEAGFMREHHSTHPQTRGKEFRIGDRYTNLTARLPGAQRCWPAG